MGVLGQGGPSGCCNPSGSGTFTAALGGKRAACFSLTTNFDILMKSKIIPSGFFFSFWGGFLIFFSPSENIAAETFYRLLELAAAMVLGRSLVSKFLPPQFFCYLLE